MNNAVSAHSVSSNRSSGVKGESLAALALQKKGMQLIKRNIRCKTGEIDLALLDGDNLVFVEVKNWPAFGLENLGFAVNEKKQRRIIETAKYFLAANREYNNRSIRFDIVFLRPGEPMVHLVSAFMESE
jgi:putative endonuclease